MSFPLLVYVNKYNCDNVYLALVICKHNNYYKYNTSTHEKSKCIKALIQKKRRYLY